MTAEQRTILKNKLLLGARLARSLALFFADEYRRGTLVENLKSIIEARGISIARDMSHADLLEEKAAKPRLRNKVFLFWKETAFTYRQMDENANRVANYLKGVGGGRGDGLAILMKNSPRWLDVFFGLEKLGMYLVPVNVALRADQLAYILDNSEASVLVADHDLLEHYRAVAERAPRIRTVVVNTEGAPEGYRLPDGVLDLDRAYDPQVSAERPPDRYDPDGLCIIMYTSGTTGLPKGVVYRYNSTNVKPLAIITRLLMHEDDVAYTCYPLFHANALFLTVTTSLHGEATVALAERFSASRFWDDMRKYHVTTFNGLGAVIPILMKQPAKPDDLVNDVKIVVTAGCPAEIWPGFERRFGLKVYEGYGAVDGGSTVITNFGTAPVGSMGRPLGSRVRIVDADGNDCPPGVPGELICEIGKKKSSVEYFKNAEATNDKVRDGWLYTGDLVYSDEGGYIYFVGRNTESMRRRGENVSAYEVEHAVLQHPDVLECAVYAVPSELTEDDIMVTLVPVEGKTLDPAALASFLSKRLAKFAIPRYYRVVDAMPKTETHRVIKAELQKIGMTEDTYDTEA